MRKSYYSVLTIGAFFLLSGNIDAQSVKDTTKTKTIDEVNITVGSRNRNRIPTDTPVPVDVLNMSTLSVAAPQSDVNQILNYVAPSFTSNTTTVADGTDHIDPAQLRGLGPDQVLVLLNGKRRHTSSLVNVNGSPGRGSVGTDLNAIPAYAIDRIEVLRDGASAQYGSDAISGVINVVMKRNIGKLNLQLFGGGFLTTGANDHRGGWDGTKIQLDANYGIAIGKKGGFINLTGNLGLREDTRRATDFNGTIFNAYNSIERVASANGVNLSSLFGNITNTPNQSQVLNYIKQFAPQVSYFTAAQQSAISSAANLSQMQSALNFDTTVNELAARGLERRDFNMRIGQSKLDFGQLYYNSEIPLGTKSKFYSFGGVSIRSGNAAGFYRRPNQNRTQTALYPNGFLPEIASLVTDFSAAVGVRGKLGTVNYDLSNTYGSNNFDYTIENTSNATSAGNQTKFNAGGLGFNQNTVNLDFDKKFDWLEGFNLAWGGELRFERYKIGAGETSSWAIYDINGNAFSNATASNRPTDFFGNLRPGGAQVFPGFRPINALNKGRNSQALYIDTELDVTKKWLLSAALRYENYSDFGSTFNYKFSTRYKITDAFALRGAVSTGFRAPSLAQLYYNSTSTQFTNGNANEVSTFSNDSDAAKLLGIPQLKQEESNNYSAGLTWHAPGSNFRVALDGYYIKIKNRVVLTDQFSRPSGTYATGSVQKQLQDLFDSANATAATFFSNAIDTQTRGIDLVLSDSFKFDDFLWNVSLAGNVTKTNRIGDIHGSDILIQNGQINRYYSEGSKIYLEEAVPRVKANLMNTFVWKKFEIFLRESYFGKVTDPNAADVNGDGYVGGKMINGTWVETEHPVWGARTITDLSFSYTFNKMVKFTLGANNLFDIYPDKNLKTQLAYRANSSGVYSGKDSAGNTVILPGPRGNGSASSVGTLPTTYPYGASTIDLSNNNQFEYSRNVGQFGFGGRFVFARINLTF